MLVMFALFALLLASCASQSAGPAATPTMELPTEYEIGPPLEQALTFVPAGHKPTLFFNNWVSIKSQEGASGVTSQSPWSDRRKLFLGLRPYNLISVYGALSMQQHAITWG